MKFTLLVATLALVSGIQKKSQDDINYDDKIAAMNHAETTYYHGDKAIRNTGVAAQAAEDAWRGVKDPAVHSF